jgi:hypothetical protein
MPKGKAGSSNQAQLLRDFELKLKKNITATHFVEICNEFKTNIENTTQNMNSRATRMAKANQMIKKKLGEDKFKISFEILRPTRAQKLHQIEEQKNIYMARLQNRIKIEFNVYLNTIDAFKVSNDYDELAVAVCLITGRRLTEIMKSGSFSPTKNEHFCLFGGQLKKRPNQQNDAYEIPLIGASSDELVRIVKKLRGLKDYSKASNEKVASVANKRPNDLIKSLFGVNITSEVIRGAYAYICYRMYSNASVSEIVYGATVLGHKQGDLATFAQNYNKTYVEMNDYSSITEMNKKLDKLIKIMSDHFKK